MGHSYASALRAGGSRHSFRPVCDPVGDDYGTVIFDGLGRICGCGAAADSLFGAGQSRIAGQLISEFIPDIHVGENSPGHRTMFLDSLCATSDWQHCDAMDVLGRGFNVGLRVSRRITNGKEVFVLNFHRPGVPLFAQIDSP